MGRRKVLKKYRYTDKMKLRGDGMNFEKELSKKKLNIRTCSVKSNIPYATLYPIIKGQIDIGTCSYYTVEKLATVLGYRPDEIVYKKVDFQTFRNDLHHQIKRNDLQAILEIIEKKEVEYYAFHEDYLKALYLVATVDYISKKYNIPLNEEYTDMRKMKLKEPFYVGDSVLLSKDGQQGIEEFVNFNIYEGDLYDAV